MLELLVYRLLILKIIIFRKQSLETWLAVSCSFQQVLMPGMCRALCKVLKKTVSMNKMDKTPCASKAYIRMEEE